MGIHRTLYGVFGKQIYFIKQMWYRISTLRRLALFFISVTGLIFLYTYDRRQFRNPPPELCIPHGRLMALSTNHSSCDRSHLILPCHDPYRSFLQDDYVLETCHATTEGSTGHRASLWKGTLTHCRHPQGELVSSPHLPVRPTGRTDERIVPNIVHYVSVGCARVFSFANYLSVRSVDRFVSPDRIYFHGDCLPVGAWWKRTVRQVPNIYFRKRKRQISIQGRKPMWVEHETDVIRLQTLLDEGGIYLDTDVFILSSLEKLRHHPVSMGEEFNDGWLRLLGSSFVMAQPGSPFICLWLHAFREYNPKGQQDWARYATIAPGTISKVFPELLHVEKTSFFKPSWDEVHKIYNGFYDWSQNYVLHMWTKAARKQVIPGSPIELPRKDDVNCTLQEIFRYIYFNDTLVRAKNCATLINKSIPQLKRCFNNSIEKRPVTINLFLKGSGGLTYIMNPPLLLLIVICIGHMVIFLFSCFV